MGCKNTTEYCGDVSGHFDWINDLYITNDGFVYSFSSDGTFRKWLENKEIVKVYAHDDKIWRAVFDERNNEFFTIAWDGWIKKWSMDSNHLIAEKQLHYNFSMAISIDNDFLFSADWNQKLVKSDKESLNVLKSVELPEIPMSCVIHEDDLLIGGKEGTLIVLDKNTLGLKQEIKLHKSMIWRIEPFAENLFVTFSYDGYIKLLKKGKENLWEVILSLGDRDEPLMGGGIVDSLIVGGTLLGDLIFWDGITGDLLLKWKAHEKASLVVRKRGNLIVSGGRDRKIQGFSLNFSLSPSNKIKGKVIEVIKKFTINGSSITPVSSVVDENGLLTGYWEKEAIYCEKVNNEWKQKLIIQGKLSAINDVELTEDKGFIVSANRKLVSFDRKKNLIEKEINLPHNPLLIGAIKNNLVIAYRNGLVEKRSLENLDYVKILGQLTFKPLKMNCLDNGVEILGKTDREKNFFDI